MEDGWTTELPTESGIYLFDPPLTWIGWQRQRASVNLEVGYVKFQNGEVVGERTNRCFQGARWKRLSEKKTYDHGVMSRKFQ